MGIFDLKPLQVPANNLLALAKDQHEKAFAEQLRAQARKYSKELAAMGDRTDDQSQNGEKAS
jgi:hypothetical protein